MLSSLISPVAAATGEALVKLDLSDNPMTAEVAPALAETVRRHPELRVLNLNDTALSDEGVAAVAEALSASAARLEVGIGPREPMALVPD